MTRHYGLLQFWRRGTGEHWLRGGSSACRTARCNCALHAFVRTYTVCLPTRALFVSPIGVVKLVRDRALHAFIRTYIVCLPTRALSVSPVGVVKTGCAIVPCMPWFVRISFVCRRAPCLSRPLALSRLDWLRVLVQGPRRVLFARRALSVSHAQRSFARSYSVRLPLYARLPRQLVLQHV